MEVIYSLIPGMILFGLIFVGVLIWAVKKGQYDDLEGDSQRLLLDEDEDNLPESERNRRTARVGKNFPDEED
jgi:cbb3-type cytochrome oxidase maturation protein